MREFGDLANAIVMQAIKDYQDAYIKLVKTDNGQSSEYTRSVYYHRMKDVDKFFESEWCNSLSQADILSMWKKKKREIEEQAELVRQMKEGQG